MNPSNYIYNIISNRLDKEEIKVLFEEMKTGNSKSLKFGPYNYKKNERTFASNSDKTSLINNRLTFDTNFYLADCYSKLGRYPEAIQVYDAILDLNKKEKNAY